MLKKLILRISDLFPPKKLVSNRGGVGATMQKYKIFRAST